MSIILSEYLVFVDESGSPSMINIDPNYPIFVLAFLIAKKTEYMSTITPAVQQFKFKHFGHDQVILHEREIRRDSGHFSFLKKPALKQFFLDELTEIIKDLPFNLICIIINKNEYKNQYLNSVNLYHLGLDAGLERVKDFLIQEGEWVSSARSAVYVNPVLHFIVERRGNNEDKDLGIEFQRICNGENRDHEKFNFEIIFADKKSNSTGLQIADLVARPIGMCTLKPNQSNRAVDAIKGKLLKRAGEINQWGLMQFP